MIKEELEKLYMDIYDNGIPDYGYKEKFKRYVNNRIENLEKENAELKKKLKEKLKTIADKDLSFVAKFDALENENAELKERLERAKKIIKDFVDRDDSCWSIQKRAEEFLKECQ